MDKKRGKTKTVVNDNNTMSRFYPMEWNLLHVTWIQEFCRIILFYLTAFKHAWSEWNCTTMSFYLSYYS